MEVSDDTGVTRARRGGRRMLLWLVVTVLACGDACDQDAAVARRSRSRSQATRRRKRPQSRSTTQVAPASQEPGALARAAPRPAASSPATGPTSPRSASFVVGVLCALGLWTDLAGPVGLRRSPTAPAPCSAGPGWRCRWPASPSPWCCCGRAAPAIPTPRRRDGADDGSTTRPSGPPCASRSARCSCFVADVAHPAPRLRPARARRRRSTTSATPAVRSARWSPPR